MMNKAESLQRFKGNGLPPDGNVERRFPYIAGEELVRAVNIALALHRPLLIKGAPGCGKTSLAAAIVHELAIDPENDFHRWHIKSTSRARDGLYTLDMVRRLQDAQLHRERAQRLAPYLSFGPLGKALSSQSESLVLIDEIDKADIDFPNDLLHELDKQEFSIEELDADEQSENGRALQKNYRSTTPPVIVITSNDEKELPDAFLRRCVFCFIPFPDEANLVEILSVNLLNLGFDARRVQLARDIFSRAAKHLLKIQEHEGQWRKTPATSELIDWVGILLRRSTEASEIDESRK
jgi:MoxR-like ATPase